MTPEARERSNPKWPKTTADAADDRCLEGLARCHYNPQGVLCNPMKIKSNWGPEEPSGGQSMSPPPPPGQNERESMRKIGA